MVRLMSILLSIIVAAVITLNAFLLKLNGYTTIEIINRLPVLFAPSDYVFLIWIFVYVFLFIWVFNYFKLRKDNQTVTNLQTILFVLTMLFQVTSILSWNYEQFILSLCLLGLQLVTLFILYLTYPLKTKSIQLRYPIAVYLGWTIFLFIFCICYVLVHIQWHGFGLSNALWCVFAMTIGAAIVLHLRYHHHDIASPIVFIWCYIGIAISNGFDELLVATAAIFLSGVMIVGILFMKKNPVSSK
ncbi:tryptophan-rich sensory protein [Ureibacillus sp. MALMAid1270]|uniref:tryptophan-rich sensory protein n=1 Tax=Ureibacillus sp. MALMAid1270 TaxID=3411629 RepID=UPI003BA56779